METRDDKGQEPLDATFSTTSIACYCLDRHGRVLGVNEKQLEQVGGSSVAPKVLGQHVLSLGVRPKTWQNSECVMESGETEIFEEEWEAPDGKLQFFLSVKSPVFDNRRRALGLIGTAVDITACKRRSHTPEICGENAETHNRMQAALLESMRQDIVATLAGVHSMAEVMCAQAKRVNTRSCTGKLKAYSVACQFPLLWLRF